MSLADLMGFGSHGYLARFTVQRRLFYTLPSLYSTQIHKSVLTEVKIGLILFQNSSSCLLNIIVGQIEPIQINRIKSDCHTSEKTNDAVLALLFFIIYCFF